MAELTIEQFLIDRTTESYFGIDPNAAKLQRNILAVIEWHKNWPVLLETEPEFKILDAADPISYHMQVTKKMAWITQDEYRKRFGTEPPTAPLLRKMANEYVDHPDFREEWLL